MIFLFSSLFIVSEVTYYVGNWTFSTTSTENITTEIQQRFQIGYAKLPDRINNSNFNAYQARTIFKNTTDFKFDHMSYSMFGLSDISNSTFFFFQIPDKLIRANVTHIIEDNITTILNDQNISDFTNISHLNEIVAEYFAVDKIVSLNFSFDSAENVSEPFLTTSILNDSYALSNGTFLTLTGNMFDMREYISQGKIFGVLSGVFLTFSFYAWYSMSNLHSPAMLNQLSLQTYLMHTSFEFSYSIYLLSQCLQIAQFRNVFLIVFASYLGLYFTFQMSLISYIWKYSLELTEIHPRDFRSIFLNLFLQVTFCMFLSLFVFVFLFEYPLLPILFLYSPYFPQIIKSAMQGSKKKHDSLCTVLMTSNRLFILWYFFLYPYNIEGSHSIGYAMFGTLYISLQTLMILLQNKLGGAFFLPRKFRTDGFDYSAGTADPNTECAICMGIIEEGDETMVTPCGHAFHKDCLTRWMREQMICPICRARLPSSLGEDNLDEIHEHFYN